MTTIAVTGSTGGLGGRVARLLAAAGLSQRLIVRDPSRAAELPGAEVTTASYADGPAVEAALHGVDIVLMVSAAEAPDRVSQHVAFIDAAARAGVGHLVYTSFVGAAPDATFTLARDHWATEEHLRAVLARPRAPAHHPAGQPLRRRPSLHGRSRRRDPRSGRSGPAGGGGPGTMSPMSRPRCCGHPPSTPGGPMS